MVDGSAGSQGSLLTTIGPSMATLNEYGSVNGEVGVSVTLLRLVSSTSTPEVTEELDNKEDREEHEEFVLIVIGVLLVMVVEVVVASTGGVEINDGWVFAVNVVDKTLADALSNAISS